MATADHLQVPRQHGLFNHHGIDLGDGTVAHYLEGREILRSPIEEFCQGQPIAVIEHEHASPSGVTLRRHNTSPPGAKRSTSGGRIRSGTGRHWSGLMPAALMRGLELLVQRGLLDDNARQVAREGVAKLERLRQKLLSKLETLLQQAGDGGNRQLLLSGQSLADELAAVEDLQERIDALLDQPRARSGSPEYPRSNAGGMGRAISRSYKYRPQRQSAVGRGHCRHPGHALTSNRIALAYLFSGPRGTVSAPWPTQLLNGEGPTPGPGRAPPPPAPPWM